MMKHITLEKIRINNLLPETEIDTVRDEIFEGLHAEKKQINSKFFYDELGSELFEKITSLPEYYPARTEKQILKSIAPVFMNAIDGHDIIELGSGDCSKISLMLDACNGWDYENVSYVPLDVSRAAIEKSAETLNGKYPGININAFVADFTAQLGLIPRKNPALICFFGSTLGNLEKNAAQILVNKIAGIMTGDDVFILGLDLVKPEKILHAAYNDKDGITEAFNKNILNVVNEIAKTDFNPDRFEHLAFYNPDEKRIEMHLRAMADIKVSSPFCDQDIDIESGECIHTENSHKYDMDSISQLANSAGMEISDIHFDRQKWFALVELDKK